VATKSEIIKARGSFTVIKAVSSFVVGATLAFGITAELSAEEVEPKISVVSGWQSKHFGAPSGQFNENNLGIGIQYRTSSNFAYTAGVYRDSIWQTSAYVGVVWTPLSLGENVRAGLFAGAVTGYDAAAVVPFGGPMIEVTVGRFMVQAVVVPKIGDLNPYTVGALRFGVSF
jgi:hypothetical protein